MHTCDDFLVLCDVLCFSVVLLEPATAIVFSCFVGFVLLKNLLGLIHSPSEIGVFVFQGQIVYCLCLTSI